MARPEYRSSGARRADHPRVTGDELFVPAPHALVIDRELSHAAFRLWCVLHRCWFLHQPPTMPLLQDALGTYVQRQEPTKHQVWQPATRRSIERWLGELEAAGWLIWARREQSDKRYVLRTTARSATNTRTVRVLKQLISSGTSSPDDVAAILTVSPELLDLDEPATTLVPDDATAESHAKPKSLTNATPGSHDATPGSQGTTSGSHNATPGSQPALAEGVLMRQISGSLDHENPEIPIDPSPPSGASSQMADGGDGVTATERLLIAQGFSTKAAREFRDLDLAVVQADLARRAQLGQGPGAIVLAWRISPPSSHAGIPASPHHEQAQSAKVHALAIAPPNANEIEIQFLALALEDGANSATALAQLAARRGRQLATAGRA